MEFWILALIILAIGITMSMVGKGGGNFYVIAMVLAGTAMHQAATTSQAIMIGTSIAAMLILNKHKKVDWLLALIIDPLTDIGAFLGGLFAGNIEGHTLKIIFASILIIVSIFMFVKVKEKPHIEKRKFGYWNRNFHGEKYTVNLLVVLPLVFIVGLFAGAVGISGGALKIPIMVMLCGIPMSIAIGTSSVMVAVTAMSGLAGHYISDPSSLDLKFALPLVAIAIIGGIIGGKLAVKNKPRNLKKVFAVTNLAAAIIMIINIVAN